MHQAHLQLIMLIKRKHQSMRQGKHKVMSEICVQENTLVRTISELEKQRQAVVGIITQQVAPNAQQPLTLAQIASFLPEEKCERLLQLHKQLLDVIKQTKIETTVAKQAGQALLHHMKGVMQMVSSAVGPGTYGRQGMNRINPETSGSISLTG